MAISLQALAEKIGAQVRGDGSVTIQGCATLSQAGEGDLSFLANSKYAEQLQTTQAAAVVLSQADAERVPKLNVLIAKDPYFAFRQAMVEVVGFRKHAHTGISDKASIAPTATIGEDCIIADNVVIADGATIGDRCVIYPHVYIGAQAKVGDDCALHPQVTVYDRCELGHRVTLHAGCSIGQDGFGYATHQGQHHKIPQAGNAVVEDDVEMGAHCSVDRAAMGSTVIGAGTKFSNSVTIGHGSTIGKYNLFVAHVGIAGSVETGDYVVLGGKVGIAGHIRIGHRVQAAAMSGIFRDVPDDAKIGGAPAQELTDMRRIWMQTQKLPDLAARVRKLEKKLKS